MHARSAPASAAAPPGCERGEQWAGRAGAEPAPAAPHGQEPGTGVPWPSSPGLAGPGPAARARAAEPQDPVDNAFRAPAGSDSSAHAGSDGRAGGSAAGSPAASRSAASSGSGARGRAASPAATAHAAGEPADDAGVVRASSLHSLPAGDEGWPAHEAATADSGTQPCAPNAYKGMRQAAALRVRLIRRCPAPQAAEVRG
jgi:hypothetical protein